MATSHSGYNNVQIGFVVSTNPEKVTVRVQFPDLEDLISHDLQVVQRKTREDKDYWIPDIGEEVVCRFRGNGLECGFVDGALYNDIDKPPVADQDKRHIAFKDGTWLEYDRAAHKLTAYVKGQIDITAEGNITAKAKGNVTLEAGGNMYLKAGGQVFVNGTKVNLNS